MLLKETCEEAVSDAVSLGVSVIDTGEHYENLSLVGKGLAKTKAEGAQPAVIAKLSGLPAGDYEEVKGRMQAMITQLGVTPSVCLIHWPGLLGDISPTDPTPLEEASSFADASFASFQENIASAWTNMVQLKEEGLVGEIGTSNFYPHHLEARNKPRRNRRCTSPCGSKH